MRPAERSSVLWLSRAAIVGFVGFACFVGCSTSDTTSPDGGTQSGGTQTSGTQTGGTGGSNGPVLDGGGEAAIPPDGAALCPAGACNYQTGAGCAAGMTCAPSASDGKPFCEPAGSAATGAPCTQWTDCVPGNICAGNVCRKLCCGDDWTGCSPTEHCLRELRVPGDAGIVDDAGTFDTQAMLCFPVNNCDALVPSSCSAIEPGTACLIADATGATACLREGKGVSGDNCPCKGGYTCVNHGCRRLCKATAEGGEPSCPEGEGRCVHWTKDPEGVGECSPN